MGLIRSGIKATTSELKNKYGASKLRVKGFSRIDLAMTFKYVALNFQRMSRYLLEGLATKEVQSIGSSIFAFLLAIWAFFAKCWPKSLHRPFRTLVF